MKVVPSTLTVLGLVAAASTASAGVVNLYSSPDGGLLNNAYSALTITVGDSPLTPGSTNEAMIGGNPLFQSGRARHASIDGSTNGVLTVPAGATDWELSYEIFIPATDAFFKRENPQVRFFQDENDDIQVAEFISYSRAGNAITPGAWQSISYGDAVPTGVNANYFDFSLIFERNGDEGANELSAFVRNVEFNMSVVPEPATASLIGLGALGLLHRRSRVD